VLVSASGRKNIKERLDKLDDRLTERLGPKYVKMKKFVKLHKKDVWPAARSAAVLMAATYCVPAVFPAALTYGVLKSGKKIFNTWKDPTLDKRTKIISTITGVAAGAVSGYIAGAGIKTFASGVESGLTNWATSKLVRLGMNTTAAVAPVLSTRYADNNRLKTVNRKIKALSKENGDGEEIAKLLDEKSRLKSKVSKANEQAVMRLFVAGAVAASATYSAFGAENTTEGQQPVADPSHAAEQPVAGSDSTHVAQQPVAGSDSTHVAQQPVAGSDSTHVAQQPVAGSDSTHVAQQPVAESDSTHVAQPEQEAFAKTETGGNAGTSGHEESASSGNGGTSGQEGTQPEAQATDQSVANQKAAQDTVVHPSGASVAQMTEDRINGADLGDVDKAQLAAKMEQTYGDKSYMMTTAAMAEPTNVAAALGNPEELGSSPTSAQVLDYMTKHPELADNDGMKNFLDSHFNDKQQFHWSENAAPTHTQNVSGGHTGGGYQTQSVHHTATTSQSEPPAEQTVNTNAEQSSGGITYTKVTRENTPPDTYERLMKNQNNNTSTTRVDVSNHSAAATTAADAYLAAHPMAEKAYDLSLGLKPGWTAYYVQNDRGYTSVTYHCAYDPSLDRNVSIDDAHTEQDYGGNNRNTGGIYEYSVHTRMDSGSGYTRYLDTRGTGFSKVLASLEATRIAVREAGETINSLRMFGRVISGKGPH
jgi:hypothetical protein